MKTGQNHIVITRVEFCPKCKQNKMPQKGQLFATIGRKTQSYKVRTATRNVPFGFTPHIMQMQSIEHGNINYTSYCAIDGCGCKMDWNEDLGKYYINPIEWRNYTVTKKDWNAMLLYKDDPQYFLD